MTPTTSLLLMEDALPYCLSQFESVLPFTCGQKHPNYYSVSSMWKEWKYSETCLTLKLHHIYTARSSFNVGKCSRMQSGWTLLFQTNPCHPFPFFLISQQHLFIFLVLIYTLCGCLVSRQMKSGLKIPTKNSTDLPSPWKQRAQPWTQLQEQKNQKAEF